MADRRTIRSLGVQAPGRLHLWSYEEAPLEDGQFRVETLYSGFSAGTELTFVKGTNPYLGARWDPEFCVFVPDEPSARYPVPFLGYMEVGRVVESRTPAVDKGVVVAMAYGHKTGHTVDARREFFLVLPPEIDPMLGVYVAQMGPICANGVLHAAAEFVGADVRDLGDGVRGRNVLVIGGGVIGLLTALFARRAGAAEVIVADPSPFRCEKARALGLRAEDEADVWRVCKERWSHGGPDRGADVVFQCRARSASLHEALRALRPQGAVIDLAFYQSGASDLRLGEEFHHNGLTVRCAQIGRVPRGTGQAWGRRRLAVETVDLLREQGPALREHLITDVARLEDAPAFVSDLVTRRRDFLQIVFEVT
jgi:threonine dehydrogenase-like Zn-dependent dehydrogenase